MVHAIALPLLKEIAIIWREVARTHSGPSISQHPADVAENYLDKAHDGVELDPALQAASWTVLCTTADWHQLAAKSAQKRPQIYGKLRDDDTKIQ